MPVKHKLGDTVLYHRRPYQVRGVRYGNKLYSDEKSGFYYKLHPEISSEIHEDDILPMPEPQETVTYVAGPNGSLGILRAWS